MSSYSFIQLLLVQQPVRLQFIINLNGYYLSHLQNIKQNHFTLMIITDICCHKRSSNVQIRFIHNRNIILIRSFIKRKPLKCSSSSNLVLLQQQWSDCQCASISIAEVTLSSQSEPRPLPRRHSCRL